MTVKYLKQTMLLAGVILSLAFSANAKADELDLNDLDLESLIEASILDEHFGMDAFFNEDMMEPGGLEYMSNRGRYNHPRHPRHPGYRPRPPHRPRPPYRPAPPPRRASVVCYAEDQHWRRFVGHDRHSARWAQNEAMNRCYRAGYNQRCWSLGCQWR